MIDEINIITKGGIVLYKLSNSDIRGEPINTIIKDYLLADKTGECKAIYENYLVHWRIDNETEMIVFMIHIKTITIGYIEYYIDNIIKKIKLQYFPNKRIDSFVFESIVNDSLLEAKEKYEIDKSNKKMRTFDETIKGVEKALKIKKNTSEKNKNYERLIVGEGTNSQYQFTGMKKNDSININNNSNNLSVISKLFASFNGTRVIDQNEALEQSEKIKNLLIDKNVNAEIATQIKSNINNILNGAKMDTFTLRGAVYQAVSDVLTRIMTPKNSFDIINDINEKKMNGNVYTIVFLGVNGVGKSTSLAKLACWLTSLNLKVMIAACDTFRAGAVDQLAVHAKKLGITLYEKGYDTDPSAIARNALKYAKEQSYDVLLVDTAGRMQGNDALMKAIAKLVHSAQTDLVLFVAEALVGNDAVNQLTTFNRYIIDYAPNSTCNGVNGIILTKFDTIDDKVGAAISLTYCTGIPILFVGSGQQYTDLKLLNIEELINSLLK